VALMTKLKATILSHSNVRLINRSFNFHHLRELIEK